ncbi:MAG: MFS transporter, partial [Schleiferilactobacillus harbinensis]
MITEHVTRKTQLAILATGTSAFIGILVETSLNVTFPTMMKQFALPLGTIQLLTSDYLLMVTIVMSMSGFLLRRFDARPLFRFALISSVGGTLLCVFSGNYWLLLIGRLVQALATGIATPLMFHVILVLVPDSQLGTYMGIASMITSFAPALGPTYGGLLTYYTSWRMIFVLTLPLLAIAAILGEVSLRLKAKQSKQAFDYWGLAFLIIVLFSLSEVFNQTATNGFASSHTLLAIGGTLLGIGLTVWRFRRTTAPLLNYRIFHSSLVRLRGINFVVLQFINIGISFVIPIFAQNFLGTNASWAGLILLPGSLIGAVISPWAGALYDRRGPNFPLLVSNIAVLV